MPRLNITLNSKYEKYFFRDRRSIRMSTVTTSCQSCVEGLRKGEEKIGGTIIVKRKWNYNYLQIT